MKDGVSRTVAKATTAQFALWANVAAVILIGLLVLSFAIPEPGALLVRVLLSALAVYGMRVLWVWMRSRQDF